MNPPAPSIADRIVSLVQTKRFGATTAWVCKKMDAVASDLGSAFESAKAEGTLLGFAGYWMTPEQEATAWAAFSEQLKILHEKHPTTFNHPPTPIATQLGLPFDPKSLMRWLKHREERHDLSVFEEGIALAGFVPKLNAKQQAFLSRIVSILDETATQGEGIRELSRLAHAPLPAVREIVRIGMVVGEIIAIADEIFLSRAMLDQWMSTLRTSLDKSFTTGQVRDVLQTSRRVAVALLEWMDREGFTERVGDERRLKN